MKDSIHLLLISFSSKAPFFVSAHQHIFQFPGVFDKIAFMIKGGKSQSFFLTFDFGLKSVNLCESLKGSVHLYNIIHSHGSLTKLLVTFVICLTRTIYSASCPEALGCPQSKWRLFPVRFVTNLI